MNWKNEIPFTIEGIAGNMSLVYTPVSVKLFQDGTEIKKTRTFASRYQIRTTDGGTETIRIINNPINGFIVEHAGVKTTLQRKLSASETVLAFLPLLIMVVCSVLFLFIGGAIGGALIGALGVISIMAASTVIRTQESGGLKIAISLGVGVASYMIYAAIGLLIIMILH